MNNINDGMAKMLKGGVIMDVSTVEEAITAEENGACAVMALDMIPSRIIKQGGICRMSNIKLIKDIKNSVSIPVMCKCRIGHYMEAKILESLEIDFIDESEVLSRADIEDHIDKKQFRIPFVCGARNLGEALRRINEGATLIRTKGEAGTGDISHAIKHFKGIINEIKNLKEKNKLGEENLILYANKERVPLELVKKTCDLGRLPVVTFAAGGIATVADAALMMHLGVDGIFVGSGIFESSNPPITAKAIVNGTIHYNDYKKLSEIANIQVKAMTGTKINI